MVNKITLVFVISVGFAPPLFRKIMNLLISKSPKYSVRQFLVQSLQVKFRITKFRARVWIVWVF